MPNVILDPTGQAGRTPAGGTFALAPRRPGLHGARVGLLINTKRNAGLLLTELGGLLTGGLRDSGPYYHPPAWYNGGPRRSGGIGRRATFRA